MKIKTFEALTMQDAIRAIKAELGSDAVILSSKRIRKGGSLFGLFGRSMVEVTAAIEMDSRDPSAARRGGRPAPLRTSKQSNVHDESEGAFPHALRTSIARETVTDAPQHQQFTKRQEQQPSGGGSSARENHQRAKQPVEAQVDANFAADKPGRARHPEAPGRGEWKRIRQELSDIRNLLIRSKTDERDLWLEGLSFHLADWYHRLIGTGLEPDTAQKVILEANGMVSRGDLQEETAIRGALRDVLARHIVVGGALLDAGDRRKAVLFVGPTGVGKTTTIAKLAAHYRLKERRRVSLVTLDTYRVAAVEQLRLYASVIGVTMDVALTTGEALECIRRRNHAELILIDTAGHSPMDAEGMEEVRRLATVDQPLEVHVVLSATTRDRDLMEGLARYASVPINRLLFTKLDETASFGGMFELMRRTGLPLSYFAIGQRVPDDLEIASPARLAELVLDPSSVRTTAREPALHADAPETHDQPGRSTDHRH